MPNGFPPLLSQHAIAEDFVRKRARRLRWLLGVTGVAAGYVVMAMVLNAV